MVIYAVQFFNRGCDVVIFATDDKGHKHKVKRVVRPDGTFLFDNMEWKVEELEDNGVAIL